MHHPRCLPWWLALLLLACGSDIITQREWDGLSYDTVAPFASAEELDEYEARLEGAGPTVSAGCEPIHHTSPLSGPGCDVEDPPPYPDVVVLPHGDHFVVLQGGLVFTSADAQGAGPHLSELDPVPAELAADAYDQRLLLRGDRVVVVSYLADPAGLDGDTGISLIDVDAQGTLGLAGLLVLDWGGLWQFDSSAAWAPDGALALFASIAVPEHFGTLLGYPTLGRWDAGSGLARGERFVPVTGVARPIQHSTAQRLALLLRCDVAAAPFACGGEGVIAPRWGSRLDAEEAVYLFGEPEVLTDGGGPLSIYDTSSHSAVYRLPRDGGGIAAARLRGALVWWGAMRVQGGELELLVANNGYADTEAVALFGPGRVARVRVPPSAFGVEAAEILADRYEPLAGEACEHTSWDGLP